VRWKQFLDLPNEAMIPFGNGLTAFWRITPPAELESLTEIMSLKTVGDSVDSKAGCGIKCGHRQR
jgi:hypothetical protein